MKTRIAGNQMVAIRMILQILLILLAVLPALSAVGQESQNEWDDAEIAIVDSLLDRYSTDSRKESMAPDSALVILGKALALAKKYNYRTTRAQIWRSMAVRKIQQDDFVGCLRYLDSAFALNEDLKDPELTCILNELAASAYHRTSNYAKAASCYFRAVQAVEEGKVEDERLVAMMYNNLSEFMYSLDESKLAGKYLLLARQHILRMQPIDSALLINIYIQLGTIHLRTDSITAVSYFKDACAMANEYSDILSSPGTLGNLSMSYVQLERYDSAEYFLNLCKAINPPEEMRVLMKTIEGLIAFGRKEYTAAERYLLHALKLTNGEPGEQVEAIYEKLSKVYAVRRNYQKAYTFHTNYMEQYTALKGEARKVVADFMLSIQALEHEKAIVKKQAQISSREAAMKRQRFWIAAMCLVSSLLCVILVLAYRNYRNKKSLLSQQMRALLQEQEIERLKAEAEGADNERSRIAHDIHDGVLVRLANVKMNLAGISPMLPEFPGSGRYRDVVGQLDMVTRELRNTAHNLMPEILLEEGMAQAIYYFCKATEQASGQTIKFQQVGTSFPRLQPHVETAVYRIVQGLVQNVIQHAEANSTLVQLQYADHLCSITVEDDGKGMNGIRNEEGYGIKSIRNRIKILHGTFDIHSQPGQGTNVYLEFDVRPFLQSGPVAI